MWMLPRIHVSDRYLTVSSSPFPGGVRMKMLPGEGTQVTRLPSLMLPITSSQLGSRGVGREMNMIGWSANRVPRYCPA